MDIFYSNVSSYINFTEIWYAHSQWDIAYFRNTANAQNVE